MLQELTPKIRAETSITHSEAGGLSTVMKLDESNEPKKNAFQLWVARLHRGAVVGVRPPVRGQADQVEQRASGQQGEQRGTHPGGVVLPAADERPQASSAAVGTAPRR